MADRILHVAVAVVARAPAAPTFKDGVELIGVIATKEVAVCDPVRVSRHGRVGVLEVVAERVKLHARLLERGAEVFNRFSLAEQEVILPDELVLVVRDELVGARLKLVELQEKVMQHLVHHFSFLHKVKTARA